MVLILNKKLRLTVRFILLEKRMEDIGGKKTREKTEKQRKIEENEKNAELEKTVIFL